MVRALVFAAIIALVAIYSRETFAKTLVNPSIAEPAITKHTKDIDDDNRSAARSHHRGGRSPSGDDLGDSEDSGDVGSSDGGDSRGHHRSSSAGTASAGYGVPIGGEGRKNRRTVFSRSQLSQLESTFVNKQYLSALEYERLADSLGLRERQVRNWFKNRRTKAGITRRGTHFSASQLSELESTFVNKQYLSPSEYQCLADSLGLEKRQVRIWFENRRARAEITRKRTDFSASQLSELESTFVNKQYLSPSEYQRLADSLGLEKRQVIVWFQNRRVKTKTQARRTTFSEPQTSQLLRAVDSENDTSPAERASSAAPPEPTGFQAQGWFDNFRREEPPSATLDSAHMALALQTNLLMDMIHHYATTVLGQSGNGNGHPVAPSVASSSRSGVLPHSVGDGTSDWSEPTDGLGMFHFHRPQYQYHGHPSRVHSDRVSSHQEYPETRSPPSSPPYPQPRRDSSE